MLIHLVLATAAVGCPRPVTQADCSISSQHCTWEAKDEAKIPGWHAACAHMSPNKCAGTVTKSQINPTLYGVTCKELKK
jgi:hypothetical protein